MHYETVYKVKIYSSLGKDEIICYGYNEDSARDYAIGYMIFLGAEDIERIEVTPLTETKIYIGRDCMPIRGKDYKIKRLPLAVKKWSY